MTRGRSGDRTYTGYNGAREETLRAKAKLAHAPAGNAGQVAHPERMQEFIEAGRCQFCGESFRNIAAHTNRTHGVDRHQLKEMAGIPKSKPACSPELSAALSNQRRHNTDPEHLAKFRAAGAAAAGKSKTYSEAGKVAQRAKLAKVDRAKVGALNSRNRAAATRDRDIAIVARLNSGESSESIQQDLGISGPTVRRVWRRLGDGRDLRSDAGKRRGISDATREGWTSASAKRRADTRAAFETLGGDWEALCQLADQRGVSRKVLRNYLVTRCGVQIDGRQRA